MTGLNMEKAMKPVTWEGIAASMMFAITNAYLTVFAAALGASGIQIGMVVAIPAALEILSYIPAGYAIERWNRRRLFCTLGSLLSRSMWFIAGSIPFLILGGLIHGTEQAVMLLIIAVSASSLFGAFVAPAWASMVGIIVPERARGSYFGRRNQLCAAASLVSGGIAGIVLEMLPDKMAGFALVFLMAGMFGVASSAFFSRFPDIRIEPERSGLLHEVRAAFKNPAFKKFMLCMIFWQFAVAMSSPFMNVYFVQGLGAPYSWIFFIFLAAGVSTMLVQRGWGMAADRFGHRSIMAISGFGAAFIPLLWALIPLPEWAILINIISGVSWAGFNLANFNYMLEITSGGKRTMYSAIYWTLLGLPLVIAPLAGGAIIDTIGALTAYSFAGYKGMFALSWALRLAATAIFAYALIEVPSRHRIPTRYVAWEVFAIGFHAVEHPFELFRKRLGYTRRLSMRLLGHIRGLKSLPERTRAEAMLIDAKLKMTGAGGEAEYNAMMSRLQRILKGLKGRPH